MEVIEDMLYISVSIWIDDVRVYPRSFENLLTRLEEVFQRLGKFNEKLNPQKTDLCPKEITWCGREISVECIKFDLEMIESLLSLPELENVANLQKSLFGASWIRSSIPEYATEVAPLQVKFQIVISQSLTFCVNPLKRLCDVLSQGCRLKLLDNLLTPLLLTFRVLRCFVQI
jgi:hypothetical protein